MNAPLSKTFRPRAVRDSRPSRARAAYAETVAAMSPDELALLSDTDGLPPLLVSRVRAARKYAADQERACEFRRNRWQREMELRDAALAAVAADNEGDVSLALNRLRAALTRIGAA